MKKILFCFYFILALSAAVFGLKKVVIGSMDMAPSKTQSISSFDMVPEIITAAFKEVGYEVVFEFYPYTRLNVMILDGAILAGIATVENFKGENAKKVMYGEPISYSQIVFFYKKSKFPKGLEYKDLTDLKNYKVATARGAPMVGMLQNLQFNLDLKDNAEANMQKLDLDRVDLVTTADIIGLLAIKNVGLNPDDYGMTKGYIEVSGNLIFSKEFPNSAAIMGDFLKGVDIIRKNGAMLKIIEKYYGKGSKALEAMNGVKK